MTALDKSHEKHKTTQQNPQNTLITQACGLNSLKISAVHMTIIYIKFVNDLCLYIYVHL